MNSTQLLIIDRLADDNDPIVHQFLNSCDVTQGSKETYQRNLKQFFLWIKNTLAKSKQNNAVDNPLNKTTVIQFKRYLQDKNLSPYSVANYMGTIKLFFAWTEENELFPNIAKSLKSKLPKVSAQSRRQALDLDQAKLLLAQIDRSSFEGMRDFAMINLMLHNGLRSIEVVRANIEDIQALEGTPILWVHGKGRQQKDDYVVLQEQCLHPILEYISKVLGGKKSGPIFCSFSNRNYGGRLTTRSVRRTVKKFLREIDLDDPRLSCHSLRHTSVTLALKGGAEIRQTQQLARHQSVVTTERYAHDLNKLEAPAEKIIASILDDSD